MGLTSHIRNKPFTKFLWIFTMSGDGYVWVPAAVTLWTIDSLNYTLIPQQIEFLYYMTPAAIAWFLGSALKMIIKRKRPEEVLENFVSEGPAPRDSSFPSSHTAAAMAFALTLVSAGHPLAGIVGLWALVVSFSRYYLGAHFPSDIIGGALLGALCSQVYLNI